MGDCSTPSLGGKTCSRFVVVVVPTSYLAQGGKVVAGEPHFSLKTVVHPITSDHCWGQNFVKLGVGPWQKDSWTVLVHSGSRGCWTFEYDSARH